ncbi:LEA type 2 family protein [Thiomicrospira pelophila]|uniref:LEA type 2 family protein n=1 Tax=Thiomicrospira pelophila TaxID=934 RepID=UPI0004A71692|nr:LEA type 2 family protein [Thiomicrospira pelophila]
MRLLPLLFGLLFFVTGCSVLQKNIQKPSAELAGVELSALDFESATLVMLVDVKNPNPVSVPLKGFDYALDVMKAPFLSGENHQKKMLNAQSTTRIQIPIKVPFAQVFDTVKNASGKNEVPFGLQATVILDLPILGATHLKLNHEGMLPIPRLPKLSVDRIEVKNISLVSVDLNIQLMLHNPNVFDVKLEQLNYELLVSGKPWLNSRQDKIVTAKAGQDVMINLPVSASFKDIGLSFYRQLVNQSDAFNYRIVGRSSIKALHPLLGEVDIPLDLNGRMVQTN